MLPAPAAAAAAVLLLGGAAAVAQYSDVKCTQNLWTLNGRGETPCAVWSTLSSFCRTPFLVPSLKKPGDKYLPPSQDSETDDVCHCNLVAFNLASACTLCQPGFSSTSLLPESEWRSGCTSYNGTGVGLFPGDASLDYPEWAYIRDNGGFFQVAKAENLAASVASTSTSAASGAFTGTKTITSTGALGTSTQQQTSQTPEDPVPKRKNNTGAIAGGVVGGLAIIALAALLLWRYRSYVRSKPALVPPREPQQKEYGLPSDMKVQYFVPPPPSSGHTSVDNLQPRSGGGAHPYAAGYAVQRNMPVPASPDPARSYTSSSNYSPAQLQHSILPFDNRTAELAPLSHAQYEAGSHPYANPVVHDDYDRTLPEIPLPTSPWAEIMAASASDRPDTATGGTVPTPAPTRPLPPLRVPQPVRHSSTSTADFSASSWNSNTPLVQQQQQAQQQQQHHHGSIDRILSHANTRARPRQPVPAPADWVIE
ncbi:hypothetical protein AURDEDRAFT_143651 [Auricularia subglabra TFB-10046 SS5]|nr:hypothetical protein AURDEDRAFT_143651 [Auricularia subglabra TFB-10046 SS5]